MNHYLKPQDIIVLLKIIILGEDNWYHHTLATDVAMSQSEVTQSLNRSKYASLIDASRKKVNKLALTEFLFHGIRYVFPQQPGPVVRGFATAHSGPILSDEIQSNETFVWPHVKGTTKGQAIEPLYKTAVEAALKDSRLYEMLSLVDSLRVGRARERELAKKELRKRILNEQ